MTRQNELPIISEGGLWKRVSKDGLKYLGGTIKVGGETIRVLFFRNRYKKADDKAPDFYFKKKE